MTHISIRGAAIAMVLASSVCVAQAAEPRVVTGGINAEFTVSNQESSIAFYHDVLGLDAPASRVNPPVAAVGKLTGTITGAAHVASMPIPGASWRMEIVETDGVERKPVNGRRQDIGAAGLILYVRDLDVALAALKKAGAPIVTTGGAPVNIGGKKSNSRAVLAKDPDGFFLELRQMDPLPSTTAPAASNVIGAAMSLSVEDTEKTARYWKEALDFDVKSGEFTKDKTEQALQGTPGAQMRKTVATYPGSDLSFEFLEFKHIDRKALMPHTQDPGSGAFAITSRDEAALVTRLKAGGQTKILTVGNDAMNQGARIAMFFQEPNGFILEAIQRIEKPGGKKE